MQQDSHSLRAQVQGQLLRGACAFLLWQRDRGRFELAWIHAGCGVLCGNGIVEGLSWRGSTRGAVGEGMEVHKFIMYENLGSFDYKL